MGPGLSASSTAMEPGNPSFPAGSFFFFSFNFFNLPFFPLFLLPSLQSVLGWTQTRFVASACCRFFSSAFPLCVPPVHPSGTAQLTSHPWDGPGLLQANPTDRTIAGVFFFWFFFGERKLRECCLLLGLGVRSLQFISLVHYQIAFFQVTRCNQIRAKRINEDVWHLSLK